MSKTEHRLPRVGAISALSSSALMFMPGVASTTAFSSPIPQDLIERAVQMARPATGVLEVPLVIFVASSSFTEVAEPEIDPLPLPRFVPDAWVKELGQIRNVDLPGALDGFYEQD